MVTRIQLRRGTAAQWTAANPTLSAGEVGVELDTLNVKVGNGTTPWNALAYVAGGGGGGPAAAGTLTGNTLAANVINSSLTSLGTIAALVATTADINGGTIDGAAIGGAVPAAGAFTTLAASGPTTVADLGLSNAVTNGGNVATIQKITQANYDLLAPAVATTLYVIVA